MNKFLEAASDLLYLLYPVYCAVCNREAPATNHIFCTSCLSELAFSDHFNIDMHELNIRFLGRQEIKFSAALFEMYTSSAVHKLIYNFKYSKRKEIGSALGRLYGQKLLSFQEDLQIDYLLAVPLHKKKMRRRGFNQSLVFAKGISEITGIPVLEDVLLKTTDNQSQTYMGRSERLQNVKESFEVRRPEQIQNKHIMIVDDIVTTGATIDACLMKLKESVDATFSIAIIALTKH